MDADQSLLDLAFDWLADDKVPDEVAALVLAAHIGIDELCARLDLPTPAELHNNRLEPIYVTAITVAGFRGIGPSARLPVRRSLLRSSRARLPTPG